MSNARSIIRRTTYGVVFLGLMLLLANQGSAPWISAWSHPWAFLGVILVTGLSLLMQAQTYRQCLPNNSVDVPFPELVRMWSLSGLVGLVAPLFAGLAVRTTILKSWGVSVRDSSLASARQILLNIEFSLLCATAVLVIHPLEQLPWIGFVFLMVAAGWWGIRQWLSRHSELLPQSVRSFASSLMALPGPMLILLSLGLPGLMALNYLVAFHGFGVDMSFHEAVLLATLTVLISATAIIPNGLGILDILWIAVARHEGMEVADSVGMALTLRLGYVCSSSMFWTAITLRRK